MCIVKQSWLGSTDWLLFICIMSLGKIPGWKQSRSFTHGCGGGWGYVWMCCHLVGSQLLIDDWPWRSLPCTPLPALRPCPSRCQGWTAWPLDAHRDLWEWLTGLMLDISAPEPKTISFQIRRWKLMVVSLTSWYRYHCMWIYNMKHRVFLINNHIV